MKSASIALVLAFGIVCSACLELTQEIWVNDDGSGRVTYDIAVPEGMLAMATADSEDDPLAEVRARWAELAEHPESVENLRSFSADEYVEEDFHHFVMDIEVDDVTLLPQTMDEVEELIAAEDEEGTEDADALAQPADMRFERLADDRLLFVQSLRIDEPDSTASVDPEMEEASRAFLASMFAGKYYIVRLHAPAVISTNGTLDDETGSLEWKIPMADFYGDEVPDELRAELQVGG
ncbi:MAG: hypothetical protein GWN99_04675 [Gemmatimonadetes bacterium]|uniref:Lipoprotein n=1 Tax=Candidatus Kutchimonas denitrificans TaxID=3056748 RepID=A0AAE4ZD09_9BACT|nr:hypothetical protein [Gemmatimonadota bacterium]NIR75745.1 hypothetical protein [Candidatus Kutchimonas denitrificans]NIS00358.1 hypothetical protein [Gemmatimonadota bacterium]NIT66017.1 hypothetical protein [Gemmatimonadota bacterium]NIU53721.1 hypothetical protein [Gemmatimonadota bacterium]